jgi:hypothetical protein
MSTQEILGIDGGLATAAITASGVLVAIVGIWINTNRVRNQFAAKLVIEWAEESRLSFKHGLTLFRQLDAEEIQTILDAGRNGGTAEICFSEIVFSSMAYITGQAYAFELREEGEASPRRDETSITLSSAQCAAIMQPWHEAVDRLEAIFAAASSKAARASLIYENFGPFVHFYRDKLNIFVDEKGEDFPNLGTYLRWNSADRDLEDIGTKPAVWSLIKNHTLCCQRCSNRLRRETSMREEDKSETESN